MQSIREIFSWCAAWCPSLARYLFLSLRVSRKLPKLGCGVATYIRCYTSSRVQGTTEGATGRAKGLYKRFVARARVWKSSSCVYTKCDIIIIRYRARPGYVLLVLHTAKRVVTTGAERSRAPVAAARHPSLRAGRHIPTRRTHTRALTTHQRTLQRGAGARAYSHVVLVYNAVYRCYIMVTCLRKLPIGHHTIIPHYTCATLFLPIIVTARCPWFGECFKWSSFSN